MPVEAHDPLYLEAYRQSVQDPVSFWEKQAHLLDWDRPWQKVLDNSNPPFTKWYVGGYLNACYNSIDRHILAGRGAKVALIHDSPLTGTVRRVTYQELYDQIILLAGGLAKMGVVKGDRVVIYMPLIPETIIAMLAIVRLGAIHSVVFGGFAARELCSRIEHVEPKLVIASNVGVEPGKVVPYLDILHSAINMSRWRPPQRNIIFHRDNVTPDTTKLDPQTDVLWSDVLKMSEGEQPIACVPIEANDPLYILYTSGNKEAGARGTTVYLVGKRIDMVPELLSSNLCSLVGGVERFAFSCVWELDKEANVLDKRFHKSVIKSKRAMTYEEAQVIIDDSTQQNELAKSLRNLNKLAKILKKRRMDSG